MVESMPYSKNISPNWYYVKKLIHLLQYCMFKVRYTCFDFSVQKNSMNMNLYWLLFDSAFGIQLLLVVFYIYQINLIKGVFI